jgi:hypothetical protein
VQRIIDGSDQVGRIQIVVIKSCYFRPRAEETVCLPNPNKHLRWQSRRIPL